MVENVDWSAALLTDFQRALQVEKITHEDGRGRSELVWNPPRAGMLKLNVDVTVNEERQLYSIGGVVRDAQSRLLLTFGKQINQPISVVHGELLEIREGVKLIYEKFLHDVQVAIDYLLVVQTITAGMEDLGYIGILTS